MATILVEVVGSAKQFKSELEGAVASTEKANSAFAKMGKAAVVAGAGLAGGVVYGLTKSVAAAEAMQVQTVRMNAAFTASGVSAKAFAGRIDEAEAKARKLGFSNENVRGSLGSLIIATHNGTKAIKDLAVAQDIARFKHVSLESATKTLTMAMSGSQRATKQLGIDVPKVTSHYDAMKATVGKTIDAHEKLALAQAKVQDKMATANLVIGTVTEKLHGQAKAYSQTAAGGMEVFHAQLGNIEEKVGTALLPALTKLTAWLVKELPVAVAAGKQAIVVLTPYFLQLKAAIQEVVTWVRAHWAQISTVLRDVVSLIAADLNFLGDLIHGRWHQIWNDFTQIVRSAGTLLLQIIKDIGPTILSALEAVGHLAVQGLVAGLKALPGALGAGLRALPGLALAAATLIGEAIVKGVKWAVPKLAGLAGDLTGKIGDAIRQVAGWALGEAAKIGREMVSGVVDGLAGLGGAVKKKVESTLGSVLSSINIPGFSPPRHAAAQAIGFPLAQGAIDGWLTGSAALPAAMTKSLQAAIAAGRAVIQAAQASFQTAWSQFTSGADAAFGGISGAKKTPAEKALAAAQATHDAAARQQALTDAQAQVAAASANRDPAAMWTAQQQLRDAQYAINIAALQKDAAAQRLQLDAKNALEKTHFDAALTNLQTHLAGAHSTYAEAHKAILKLFKSFGVSYSAAGADLGTAFVTGLKESIQGAASKSGSLSGKLHDVAAGINVPHAATGGFVAQTGLAVIHQGETITPAGGGGGVYNITVNAGWIGNDQEIAERLRNELIRTGRRNPGIFGGFA